MKYRNSTSNRTTASAHPKRHNRRQPTFPTPPPSPSLLSPRLLISSLFLSLFSFSSYYYLYLTLPYFTLLYLSLPYFIFSLSFSLSSLSPPGVRYFITHSRTRTTTNWRCSAEHRHEPPQEAVKVDSADTRTFQTHR